MRIGDVYEAPWGRWVVFAITPVIVLHACDRVGAAIVITELGANYRATGERNELVHGFRVRRDEAPCTIPASTAADASAWSAGAPATASPRASSPSITTPATTAANASGGTACETATETLSATAAPAELVTTSAHHRKRAKATPAPTSREPSQVDMFASLPAPAVLVGGYLATVQVEVAAVQPESLPVEPPPTPVSVPGKGSKLRTGKKVPVSVRDINLMGQSDPGPERIAELRGGKVGQWIAEASAFAAQFLTELQGVAGSLVWVEIEPVAEPIELDDGPAPVGNVEYPAWWSPTWVCPSDDLPWVVVPWHGHVTIFADWPEVLVAVPDSAAILPLRHAEEACVGPPLHDVTTEPPPLLVTDTCESEASIPIVVPATVLATLPVVAVVEASPFPLYVPADREAWLEDFAERAAIIEYMGGLPRQDSEALAWEMLGPEPATRSPIR